MRTNRQKRFTFLTATIAPLVVVLTLGVAAAQAMRGPDGATHPPSTTIHSPANATVASGTSAGASTTASPPRAAGRIAVSSRRGTLTFGRARTGTSSSALAVAVGLGSAAALALIVLVAAGWPRRRAEVVALAGSGPTTADGSGPSSQDRSPETRRKAA